MILVPRQLCSFSSVFVLSMMFLSCAMESSSSKNETPEKTPSKLSANQTQVKIAPKGKVPTSPGSTLLVQANKYFQGKDYAHAYDYYVAAWNRMGAEQNGTDSSSLVIQAHLGAIRSADHLARWAELQQLTLAMDGLPGLKDNEKAEVLQYRLRSLTALGYYLEALQKMQDNKKPEQFKASIQEIVDNRLKPEELKTFVSKNSNGPIASIAYLRLGDLAGEQKDFEHQKSYL